MVIDSVDYDNEFLISTNNKEQLGFETSLERMSSEPPHQRARLWNGEDYCILDQLNVKCVIK